ncbi:MAG: DUF2079 domain-containing protein, partial [Thermostichus sp. DRC_bins_24]
RGIHILGDHAAFILYPIALLYRIVPSVYWLFGLQSLALSLGSLPVCYLALQAGLRRGNALLIAGAYLVYPAIFNANLFDFHPEVLAVPLFLAAVFFIRAGWMGVFCLCLIGILGCKAVLALTVVAFGGWLLIWERSRLQEGFQQRCQVAGWIAVAVGSLWFVVATFWIIPQFSGGEPAAVSHYRHLGESVIEIAQNLVLRPMLILGQVFSLDTLFYGFLLIVPLAWGLSWRHWDPLFPALPTLALNILSSNPAYRDLVHHYALPIIPFLVLTVIESFRVNRAWIPLSKVGLIWSLLAFLALAKYGFFGSIYLTSLDTWQATRQALSLVGSKGGVLTTHEISPHLTHRAIIDFTDENKTSLEVGSPQWDPFDYVLLNSRHPGWRSSRAFSDALVLNLQQADHFQLLYQQDEVYLFARTSR